MRLEQAGQDSFKMSSNGVAPINGIADRQVVKEFALGQLGLRCKKLDSDDGTTFSEALPIQSDYYDHATAENNAYGTEQAQGDDGVGDCDDSKSEDNVEDSSRDQVEEQDSSASEEEVSSERENENEKYSFNNLYEQMKTIHGDENGEREDGDSDSGDYVDNTDDDRDWDPYCEDAESEDSDVNPASKRRRESIVNGAFKRRKLCNHSNVSVNNHDGQRVVGFHGDETPKYTRCEYEGTVYYCTPCNRRYHTKTGFSQHKRFECGKPPAFQCLICNKEFNRKSSLKRHLRQIHKTALALNDNCVVHHDKLSNGEPPQAGGFHHRGHYSPSSATSGSTTSEEDHRRGRNGGDCRSQAEAMRHSVVRRQVFSGRDFRE